MRSLIATAVPSTERAPFAVAVCPIGFDRSADVQAAAQQLHDGLAALGIDVVLDDRGERPGAMFADWELIGVPQRVVVSDRALKDGKLDARALTRLLERYHQRHLAYYGYEMRNQPVEIVNLRLMVTVLRRPPPAEKRTFADGTVRKAIDELATENLLVRRQGKGTFVATHAEEKIQYRFLRLQPEDESARGMERRFLDCRRMRASAAIVTPTPARSTMNVPTVTGRRSTPLADAIFFAGFAATFFAGCFVCSGCFGVSASCVSVRFGALTASTTSSQRACNSAGVMFA